MSDYPRIKDLPIKEQKPFKKWLHGQTMPLPEEAKNTPSEEWDWYFTWDYIRWKKGLSVLD